jgi:hypothetical protein
VRSDKHGDHWTLSIDDMANTLDVDSDTEEIAKAFVAQVTGKDPWPDSPLIGHELDGFWAAVLDVWTAMHQESEH